MADLPIPAAVVPGADLTDDHRYVGSHRHTIAECVRCIEERGYRIEPAAPTEPLTAERMARAEHGHRTQFAHEIGRGCQPWRGECLEDLMIRLGVVTTPATELRPGAALDVERLGLSGEQTRNLRQHLIARQQTLGAWISDVLFEMRMGRPDGIEYPPALARLIGTDSASETGA